MAIGLFLTARCENSLAVFAIDQTTGEPTLIQKAAGHGNYLRLFNIDPSGKLLIAAPLWAMPMRDPSGLSRACALPHRRRRQADLHPKVRHRRVGEEAAIWAGMVALAS